MYATSPKVADLQRDPRFALHSMMDNDDGVGGEFALHAAGRRESAIPARSPPPIAPIGELTDRPRLVLFELGVDDVVIDGVPGRGHRASAVVGADWRVVAPADDRQATRPGEPSGAE